MIYVFSMFNIRLCAIWATCVDTCLQNHLVNFYFYAISYYPPGSSCWCNEDSTFTGTQIPSAWITMIVWSKELNYWPRTYPGLGKCSVLCRISIIHSSDIMVYYVMKLLTLPDDEKIYELNILGPWHDKSYHYIARLLSG